MTEDLLSNRTYLMSPRAKSVVDNASIMLPGYSKTEVVNTAIFLLGSEIRRGDPRGAQQHRIRRDNLQRPPGPQIPD